MTWHDLVLYLIARHVGAILALVLALATQTAQAAGSRCLAIADAAPGLLQVDPHSRQARQGVLELRQFHLRLGNSRAGAGGKDIEDERGAVDQLTTEGALQVADLDGGEVVVKNHEVRLALGGKPLQLFDLAFPNIRSRVDACEMLRDAVRDVGAGRVEDVYIAGRDGHIHRLIELAGGQNAQGKGKGEGRGQTHGKILCVIGKT